MMNFGAADRMTSLMERMGLEVAEMTAILHCPRGGRADARTGQGRTAALIHQKFILWSMKGERLSTWPTRFLAGNYVAVRGIDRRV